MSYTISNSTQLITVVFAGNTSAGGISVPGLKVGDVVVGGTYSYQGVLQNWGPYSNQFEATISIADQIQQQNVNNMDWSNLTFTVYLLRGIS